jgi:hypothetical protein
VAGDEPPVVIGVVSVIGMVHLAHSDEIWARLVPSLPEPTARRASGPGRRPR